jgi:hypothetical protein
MFADKEYNDIEGPSLMARGVEGVSHSESEVER